MHLHFEKNTNTKCDCSILSLSWMGKVPDDIPEEEGWKLNRTNYYQEGWLATGNIRGIVGVTFTTSHCKKKMDYPLRTNYNLRGHRSEVILVKWNEPYQKLASCDSSGIIFVWIKYEGRWSIELINDRNTPVTHFSWSHDGRMALICYQDGFVLVGSVAGQRYWSSMLNLDATITCGIWTPDDQQVYFGTTQGQVIVMDVHGAMVSQVQLCSDVGITGMAWSCEKFKMEEGEDTEPGVKNASKRTFVLAVSFRNGYIYLLKSFDDVSPAHINTGLNGTLGFVMEWSNSRELLAVAGTAQITSPIIDTQGQPIYENLLKFYTETGTLLYTARIPNNQTPVSALTWGHNDKRIFIATGTQVHIAWVSRRVASLQLLCRLQIQACLSSETLLPKLPLPAPIKAIIGKLFAQTIRCCVPDSKSLREFVSRPPVCSTRLHCTMIRHDDDSNIGSGSCYTLYLEYLGGLVPLLKGKRTSKIRPEFVIFDPQVDDIQILSQYSPDSSGTKSSSGSSQSTSGTNGRSDSSESDLDDRCRGSPRMQRKRKTRTKRKNQCANTDKSLTTANAEQATSTTVPATTTDIADELAYVDTLPEDIKLVEVTSNIWGTKFKIHGLAKTVPANLGQVTYKTSLLHLQPRQMTLVITELRDDFPTGPDPSFNPNLFSEDEEEQQVQHQVSVVQRRPNESCPPIAPMSPRPNRFLSRPRNQNLAVATSVNNTAVRVLNSQQALGPLARAESYEDEFPYVDLTDIINASETLRPNTVTTNIRPGPSYTSLVSRPSSSSSGQSRHAISPLCCEGSVPTLQSPKNAVAPSDIIFDRPPAGGQTTLMSYSSNTDYTNNVVQVKNALISDQPRTNSHVNPVPLNLNLNLERVETKVAKEKSVHKKKEIKYIDEETPTTASPVIEMKMQRTPTVASIAPAAVGDSITRSCSVGYLDSVEMAPLDVTLSVLRRDAPNKRLVLVDRKPHKKNRRYHDELRRPKLQQSGKSKSLDSCDLLDYQNSNQNGNIEPVLNHVMPKLNETSENDTDYSSDQLETTIIQQKQIIKPKPKEPIKRDLLLGFSKTPILNRKEKPKCCSICKNISPTVNSTELVCAICKKSIPNVADNQNNNFTTASTKSSQSTSQSESQSSSGFRLPFMCRSKHSSTKNILDDANREGCSKSIFNNNNNNNTLEKINKKKTEVITSYTDSPLFSRKHRFSDANNSRFSTSTTDDRSPLLSRKSDLAKQLSEKRRKKKDESPKNNGNDNGNNSDSMQPIEITPVEPKTSVSLHTQALTTLESIISRLRDLDDGRLTPPQSPRLPRSSPASPAPSKKGKRHQSASPIRHILNSPLLNRRQRKKQPTESSDDEQGQSNNNNNNNNNSINNNNNNGTGGEETIGSKQYRDLETFQKAQLRQKLKRGKIEPNGHQPSTSQPAPLRREFVMHNKAPMWNENSQVYQLDFGGRVTQESAKNFQIEFRGKQVMQFGRIDGNAYTLDFQYPFSALQAFAVALANVTQRLK